MFETIQITLVNLAIFFGQYLIVATALNFQFGNAGIPNMSNNISVACGAYVVSSLVLKICMWVAGFAGGLTFKPDWVYDNPYNIAALNSFLRVNPLLSLGFFILSIALALVLGSLLGWLLAAISGRLRSSLLMMFLLVISDAGGVIVANNRYIAGGTTGSFVPNFLTWYPGGNTIIVALSTLIVGIFCYFTIKTMQNSPFGRLMRAVRENEWTVESVGKNIIKIRREVMMFSSGMMAVTGVLLTFYYNFVQYQFYDRNSYTFWPWLMITIGGTGNNAGAFIGVIIGVSILRILGTVNSLLSHAMAGTGQTALMGYLGHIGDMVLGALLLIFMICKPRGIIPEKQLVIPGINYKKLVLDEKEE
ncbi:MAG: branched-chain amino acid ABC transporter permease [Candidatus Bathyarchaeota archaeon]